MAEAMKLIFNQKAAEKLRNPDDLDKYVRVTNPSVWVVLGACVALIIGLLAWGVFGTVATSVSTTGTVVDGTALCFLSTEDVAKVNTGDAANVGGVQMVVDTVAPTPISPDESKDELKNSYLVSTLMNSDWAYRVTFSGDTSTLEDRVPVPVSITTERIAPISLILKGDE